MHNGIKYILQYHSPLLIKHVDN